MTSLRSKVIRLAHARPELRPALLPLLKEAAYPRTEVKFRDREGLWSGIAQDIATIMIVSDVPKNLRDRIMDALLAGESPVIPAQAVKEMKRRKTIRKVVTTPSPAPGPKGPSPSQAQKKLDALMKVWARNARKDWLSDNPGTDISDVARDLASGFVYEWGVPELIAASGMRKNLVVDMVAEQLAG